MRVGQIRWVNEDGSNETRRIEVGRIGVGQLRLSNKADQMRLVN